MVPKQGYRYKGTDNLEKPASYTGNLQRRYTWRLSGTEGLIKNKQTLKYYNPLFKLSVLCNSLFKPRWNYQ
jgi:hypothetical protein